MAGSSPHTRDKSNHRRVLVFPCRIIPAYAGQIYLSDFLFILSQDHPRIRGTNQYKNNKDFLSQGSSPHTRDKCPYKCVICLLSGIIPAYAGQIPLPSHALFLPEDHPRIRGTNTKYTSLEFEDKGSPPHTRDK